MEEETVIKELLFVEDDAEFAAEVLAMFTLQQPVKWHVTYVKTFEAMLQHLIAHHVDFLVMDLSLSDMRRFLTVARLFQAAPHVPVVALTDIDTSELPHGAMALGALGFQAKSTMTKNSAIFFELLDACLSNSQRERYILNPPVAQTAEDTHHADGPE